MTTPYYSDEWVQLFHGDCREVLPLLGVTPDACCTDPPYGETSAAWDRWPTGWVDAVGAVLPSSASLWCFGSARMFLARRDDFAGWKFAQEALWVKTRGSRPGSRERLTRVHEWAYHWYRGRWSDLHHEWERVAHDGPRVAHEVRASSHAAHRTGGEYRYDGWVDDGFRQPKSVMVIEAATPYRKGHQDQKPVPVVVPLVRECAPPGGLVLDCFAGTGTTGVAAKMTGRRALLIEADERSCEIAAERLAENCLDFIKDAS